MTVVHTTPTILSIDDLQMPDTLQFKKPMTLEEKLEKAAEIGFWRGMQRAATTIMVADNSKVKAVEVWRMSVEEIKTLQESKKK